MKLIYNPIFLQHQTGMHPENPKRLEALGDLPVTELISGEPFLELIHTRAYLDKVKAACALGAHLDADTVTSKHSYEAAVYAVGATIMASQTEDFALVRPPGHHAFPDRASGFCIFNNVAIAAERLAREGKKVLIFDFDGHLGDGTSHIFYDNPQVMYWSIHQYPAFPGHGWVNEIGTGKGKGFTINVPLPPASGDDIFMNAVDSFLPVAKKFQPDVVAVSAGFDAHQYDLLLDLRVSVNSYFKIGELLRKNFDHIFATLEGGYNIEELPRCIENFRCGINGLPMPFQEKETESSMRVWQEYDLNLHLIINELSPYWKF